MKKIISALVIVAGFIVASSMDVHASLLGSPLNLKAALLRVNLDAPALPPFAHTRFCMRYPEDCKVRRMVFRPARVRMNADRWGDLKNINLMVNRSIAPKRNERGLVGEEWLLSPREGDCNDYAVTKRHELIGLRWPSRSLLLAEVVTASGEHHLVLVVRTREGDIVLDNLAGTPRPLSATRYRWVRVQTPDNPLMWAEPQMVMI